MNPTKLKGMIFMGKNYINPICTNAADPFVLLYNEKYYLYSTNASDGFKVFESCDLISWTNKGYCLKSDDVVGESWFWAPEVIFYNNKFYMVYTADMHIAVAVSDSPLGPFKQEEKKWLIEKRAIDGSFFLDDDGNIYLYYNQVDDTYCIAGVKMNDDMKSVDEKSKKELLFAREFEWEKIDKNVIEGPFTLKHNGKYYLTYSANGYTSIDYAVGYAVSDSPLGEFKKYEGNPILHRSDTVYGTGHHSFTTSKDGKTLICVYHCHNSTEEVHPRNACIDVAEFVPCTDGGDDVLRINGPTSVPMPAIY